MFEEPMFLSGGTQHGPALSGTIHPGAGESDTQALGLTAVPKPLLPLLTRSGTQANAL
jgi:hypothetical protein